MATPSPSSVSINPDSRKFEDTPVNNSSAADINKSDRLTLLASSVFVVGVAGFAMLSGFSFMLAGAKRKHPSSFTKGLFNEHGAISQESGASLGVQALKWGTLYAVTGVGALTIGVCKIMGVKTVDEFKTKFQKISPRIRRDESNEPEEVLLEKLRREILEDEDNIKNT